MTGKYGDTINTICTESRGWIDSSGVITHISLEDSVFNTITIKEIIPDKAWGYGQILFMKIKSWILVIFLVLMDNSI